MVLPLPTWFLALAPHVLAGWGVLHVEFKPKESKARYQAAFPVTLVGEGRLKPSPRGTALQVDAKTHIRVDPNLIDGDTGTVALWVRSDWSWQSEDTIHTLLQFSGDRWRSNMMRLVYWPKGTERLRVEVRHGEDIWLDGYVGDWRKDDWHHVAVTWHRRPGKQDDIVRLYGDGRLLASCETAELPTKVGPWLYVGDNQNRPPKNEPFVGAIDDLWVVEGKALDDFRPHGVRPKRRVQTRGEGGASWSNPHRYRMEVAVPATKREWSDAPVVLRVRAETLATEIGIPARRLASDSFRVTFVAGAKSERPIPHKLDFEPGVWRLCWRSPVPSDRARRFRVYFDERSRPIAEAPPAFIGGCEALTYGRKGVRAPLGTGLWACPAPLHYDDDGRLDLLYSCADKPCGGTYLYKRLSEKEGKADFRLVGRMDSPHRCLSVCDWDGDKRADVLVAGGYYKDVRSFGFDRFVKMTVPKYGKRVRAHLYRATDWDADGVMDLLVANGDWSAYGWDKAYNERGEWTRGPLHGWVWFFRNTGSAAKPEFDPGRQLMTDHWPVDVFGRPGVCVADWDSDGDNDLLIGEFLDRITYFENVGTKSKPKLATGRFLTVEGKTLKLDLCMIMPSVCDFDGDGDMDLIVGEEDGYVDLFENVAGKGRMPVLKPAVYLTELDPPVKSGALVVPSVADWDGDGDDDIVVGNTAGYLELFVNEGQNGEWKIRRAGYLQDDAGPIRILAGYNGSIQGPCETKWGYTVPTVADWDGDGKLDVLANGIIGRLQWWRRRETNPDRPMDSGRPLHVRWKGDPPYPKWNWWRPGYTGFDSGGWGAAAPDELVTQWRTRPQVTDWNGDGLADLVSLDHEGYLALYRRTGEAGNPLSPGERVFLDEKGKPLRLTTGVGGRSGRIKICLVDWDRDGDLDLLKNTRNVGWYENVTTPEEKGKRMRLAWRGDLIKRRLAGHTSSPEAVDFNRDGWSDILLGAEDGRLYCIHRALVDDRDGCIAEIVGHGS